MRISTPSLVYPALLVSGMLVACGGSKKAQPLSEEQLAAMDALEIEGYETAELPLVTFDAPLGSVSEKHRRLYVGTAPINEAGDKPMIEVSAGPCHRCVSLDAWEENEADLVESLPMPPTEHELGEIVVSGKTVKYDYAPTFLEQKDTHSRVVAWMAKLRVHYNDGVNAVQLVVEIDTRAPDWSWSPKSLEEAKSRFPKEKQLEVAKDVLAPYLELL